MAEFDELSVSVAADTMDFKQGINQAENSLNAFDRSALQAAANADILGDNIDDVAGDAIQAAASMRALKSQTEGAGDELTQTAIQAGIASGGMSQLSTTTSAASASSLGLSTALTASVAPALAIVAAAAVPVVAALGGLVAVVGSIAGVGFIGALAAIATNTKEIKNAVSGVVETLRSEFSFAISSATSLILGLLQTFEAIIPKLVPANDAIREIGGSFQELGETVIRLLPELTGLAVTLAREFLPPLVNLAQRVLPQLPGFIRDLVGVFRRLIPSFREGARILSQLSPQLLEFGFVALNVVGPALAKVARFATDALTQFNQLSGDIQRLGVQAAALAPIVLGLVSILGGPVTLAIAGVIGAVVGLRKAWENNIFGIVAVVNQFVNQAQPLLDDIRKAFAAFVDGVRLGRLRDDIVEFEQVVSEQLFTVIRNAKPLFNDLEQLLKNNREEFRIIGHAVGNFLEGVIDLATFLASGIGPLFRNVILPVLRGFVTLLDGAIKNTANLIELFGALEAGNLAQAQQELEEIETVGAQTFTDLIGEGNIQAAQENISGLVEIVIEEDTNVVNATARSEANRVIVNRERRASRLGNRGSR